MSTISSTTCTFEPSSAPCLSLPKCAVARTAFVRRAAGGGFLEQVLAQGQQAGRIDEGGQRQLAQFGRRGLAGMVALTMPFSPMVIAVALFGTVICGTSGRPWALTSTPFASTCSWPARV
jgi:hypothetical protein